MDFLATRVFPPNASRRRRNLGFTLVEAMVSLTVLALTGISSVSGFMLLNRYASDNRDRAAARMLCQERVEQILTLPFRPYTNAANKTKVVPIVAPQSSATNSIYPLGKETDYDDDGSYKSGTQQTSNEAVTIYMQPNGSQVALAPVTGTRTTTLSAANGDLKLMRVAVTVTWINRGKTNSYTLYTLRTLD